jgi:hypothetical protein
LGLQPIFLYRNSGFPAHLSSALVYDIPQV